MALSVKSLLEISVNDNGRVLCNKEYLCMCRTKDIFVLEWEN
jgi:hypothetical protein